MFYKYANFSDINVTAMAIESYTFTNGKVGILTNTWDAFWDKAPNYETQHPTKI